MGGHLQVLRPNGLENGMEGGRGVTYADQERYYVVNDAQDPEYLGSEDNVKYYRGRVEVLRLQT